MSSKLVRLAYEGHPINIRDDGWFNATQASAKWKKLPNEWLRLPGTQSYIAAFRRKYGNIPHLHSRRGVNGGTWLHPKLAVAFARWLDDDFAVWCDCQIDDIIRGKQDWSRTRHMSAASAKLLAATVKDCRDADGKETTDVHYMCEHKLVNWLLTGEFKGLDRDQLAGWQLDFIGHFDLRDSMLMMRGVSYDKRKEQLAAEAVAWKVQNAHRILASNDPGSVALVA